jgi:phosphatidylglycerophosphatase GEP4
MACGFQTLPHEDKLVPILSPAFSQALKVFTPQRVVIVSNSSGTTSEDPGFIEAQSVERELRCHVLRHNHKKPTKACASEIAIYFTHLSAASSAPGLQLVLIGDRLLTDMLLANEMGAYGIWTTHLWEREALLLRAFERGLLAVVRGWRALWR